MKILRYIILMLLLASPAFGATYYVDKTTGDNSDSGLTEALAWETIAKVNDFAEATGFSDGDIIQFKRGETWTSDETLGWDGDFIAWGTINGLTIQDYGAGDLPLLDGNTQHPILIVASSMSNLTIKNLDCSGQDWPTNYAYGNVTIFNVIGVTVDGLYIDGHAGSSTYNYHPGALNIVSDNQAGGVIEVKNCTIKNMYKDTFANTLSAWGSNDCPGIFFYFSNGGKTSGSISVHGNTVDSVYSDSVAVEGSLVGAEIYNNTISSFGEDAIETKASRYVNVYNNDISWNDFGSTAGESYWGATVFVGEPASITNNQAVGYHTFHDNYVHDSALACIRSGASLGLDVYNNYFKDVGMAFVATSGKVNQRFYNNLVVQTVAAGSSTAMDNSVYKSGATVSATSSSNLIYNNSFYISSSNHNYGVYLYDGVGTIVKNNIVYMTRNNAAVFPLYSAGTGPTISYNDLYNSTHSNRAYENGTTYDSTEQADWRTAGHTSGLFGDPEFTTPGTTFTLDNADNINVDSGANLGADYDDGWNPTTSMPPVTVTTIDQDMRGTGWERGAYVYDGDPITGGPITITPVGAIGITPDADGAITITY